MRNHLLFISLLASLTANSGCMQTECGEGTIDRDGSCEPATEMHDPTVCGPFTELQGDRCVPMFPPTMCDPTTSEPSIDPNTGIVTCIGTGVTGGCGSPLACVQPTGSTKLTICGQLYDFENGSKFAAADATGAKCDSTAPTTSGPCALTVLAFDALVYGGDQTMGNVTPTGPNDLYIDDCGRYRVANIETNGTGPFIGLGFTEAGKAPQRPLNQLTVTATTGVATQKPSSRVVDKLEAFIAKPSMLTSWEQMGPPLSGGIYVGLFKAHKIGNGPLADPQPGVKFTKAPGNTIPNQDFYFNQTGLMNTSVDAAATQTGENGNGILINASVSEANAYSGTGGITSAHCTWENHAAANLANIVFFQIYRKVDVPLDTIPCPE